MTDVDALAQIQTHGRIAGKRSEQRTMVAIAHGLAWDPHIDGRLKLTSVGLQRLGEAAEPEQGSLL